MRLVLNLIRAFLGRRKTAPRSTPPTDPERLQGIYREQHRRVEALRRAA